MKRMKSLALAAVAFACMAVMMTGCSKILPADYEPEAKEPTISAPAISEEGVLKVGVNAQNAPMAGMPSGSSDIVGIDADVAAALADQLGLKVELVDVGTDADAALAEGTVDVVLGINAEDAEMSSWISDPYMETAVALFSLTEGDACPQSGTTISAAAQVSSSSAWAVSNEFGDDCLVSSDSLDAAFDLLDAGDVQYVASDAIIGSYSAHTAGRQVYLIGLVQPAAGYCAAVNADNAELQEAVEAALQTLSEGGIVRLIENKWLGMDINLDLLPLCAEADAAGEPEEADDEAAKDEAADDEAIEEDIEEDVDPSADDLEMLEDAQDAEEEQAV